MDKRKDLEEKVIQEIITGIDQYIQTLESESVCIDGAQIYQEFLKNGFIQITPPEEGYPVMRFINMDSLSNYRHGSSIKPGNIRLNMKKLVKAIPSVTQGAINIASDKPILAICVALSLLQKIWEIATVEISKEQAFVIVALWENCNYRCEISLADGYIATNRLLKLYGEAEITNLKYNKIIDSLIKLRCIELTGGIIRLIEWISKRYRNSI